MEYTQRHLSFNTYTPVFSKDVIGLKPVLVEVFVNVAREIGKLFKVGVDDIYCSLRVQPVPIVFTGKSRTLPEYYTIYVLAVYISFHLP